MNDLWIRNVRVAGSTAPTDLVISAGRISSVGAAPDAWAGGRIDGEGMLAIAGLVDGHAHVDKTLWGLPWRPHSAGPTLASKIENGRVSRRELPPTFDRATEIFETYVATGTSLIRTHVDVDLDDGIAGVEGVLDAAERFADRLDVQIVAFPQCGILASPGVADLLDAAVRAGASHVGGIDPAGFDGDPVRSLDLIFGIAERHGCGIDIHLHDGGSLGRWEMRQIIDRTRALGLHGKVTISHAFCLCDGDPAVEPLIEQLAEAGISLATVAPNTVEPLPFARLTDLGVGLALGQDGVRDLWSPWGDADMLSRAALMAWRSDFRRDDDIEFCLGIATTRGAAALGVDDQHLAVGGRGDLFIVDAENAAAATVIHPPRAWVVKRGAIVAGTKAALDTATGFAAEPNT